ncbi:MAG: DUF4169 family protein [Alphaproteobacteria bacterium]
MAEIVNLRRHKKRKARTDKAATADANRARFGRTGVERRLDQAKRALETERLEAHRLDDEDHER